MRGSPLFRLILVCLGLLLAGLPVWNLTRIKAESLPRSQSAPEPESGRQVDVEMTASAPGLLTLSSLGRPLLESGANATSMNGQIFISKKSPEDLVASAKWPAADASHALRIVIKDNGKILKDVTLWGKESVEDVLP